VSSLPYLSILVTIPIKLPSTKYKGLPIQPFIFLPFSIALISNTPSLSLSLKKSDPAKKLYAESEPKSESVEDWIYIDIRLELFISYKVLNNVT